MSKTIDMSPEARKTVKELLQGYLSGVTVWAYGSRVKWTARSDSDLDLVVFAGKEQRGAVANLREAFEESNLPFRVDVFIWDEVPERFRGEIQEGYVVVEGEEKGLGVRGKWQAKTLEDLADEITVGHVGLMTSEYIESGIPFLRSKNVDRFAIDLDDIRYISREFHDRLKKSALTPGDVVIVRTGKPGAAALIPSSIPEANCSDLVIVRPSAKLDRRFLVYYLNSIAIQHINSHLVGAVQQHFNVGAARKLRMCIPELPEQKAIAHLLGTLDDKIELNCQMNQTLEEIAQSIFKSWFVDFDPVKAKQAAKALGGNPERAAMAALSGKLCVPKNAADLSVEDMVKADAELDQLGEQERKQLKQTAALFPDGFVESELGLIPEGWEVGPLKEHFNLTMGQSPPGSTYNEDGDGLPFFQGTRDFGFRYPTKRVFCTAPSRVSGKGDTLVSVRAPVGDVNMALESCCVGRGVAAVRHKSEARSFTYYSILNLKPRFMSFDSEGTVFGSLNKKSFETIGMIAPIPSLIDEFERYISGLDSQIENLFNQSLALAQLRDTLLPKLLSGELPINALESTADNRFVRIPEVV